MNNLAKFNQAIEVLQAEKPATVTLRVMQDILAKTAGTLRVADLPRKMTIIRVGKNEFKISLEQK